MRACVTCAMRAALPGLRFRSSALRHRYCSMLACCRPAPFTCAAFRGSTYLILGSVNPSFCIHLRLVASGRWLWPVACGLWPVACGLWPKADGLPSDLRHLPGDRCWLCFLNVAFECSALGIVAKGAFQEKRIHDSEPGHGFPGSSAASAIAARGPARPGQESAKQMTTICPCKDCVSIALLCRYRIVGLLAPFPPIRTRFRKPSFEEACPDRARVFCQLRTSTTLFLAAFREKISREDRQLYSHATQAQS